MTLSPKEARTEEHARAANARPEVIPGCDENAVQWNHDPPEPWQQNAVKAKSNFRA